MGSRMIMLGATSLIWFVWNLFCIAPSAGLAPVVIVNPSSPEVSSVPVYYKHLNGPLSVPPDADWPYIGSPLLPIGDPANSAFSDHWTRELQIPPDPVDPGNLRWLGSEYALDPSRFQQDPAFFKRSFPTLLDQTRSALVLIGSYADMQTVRMDVLPKGEPAETGWRPMQPDSDGWVMWMSDVPLAMIRPDKTNSVALWIMHAAYKDADFTDALRRLEKGIPSKNIHDPIPSDFELNLQAPIRFKQGVRWSEENLATQNVAAFRLRTNQTRPVSAQLIQSRVQETIRLQTFTNPRTGVEKKPFKVIACLVDATNNAPMRLPGRDTISGTVKIKYQKRSGFWEALFDYYFAPKDRIVQMYPSGDGFWEADVQLMRVGEYVLETTLTHRDSKVGTRNTFSQFHVLSKDETTFRPRSATLDVAADGTGDLIVSIDTAVRSSAALLMYAHLIAAPLPSILNRTRESNVDIDLTTHIRKRKNGTSNFLLKGEIPIAYMTGIADVENGKIQMRVHIGWLKRANVTIDGYAFVLRNVQLIGSENRWVYVENGFTTLQVKRDAKHRFPMHSKSWNGVQSETKDEPDDPDEMRNGRRPFGFTRSHRLMKTGSNSPHLNSNTGDAMRLQKVKLLVHGWCGKSESINYSAFQASTAEDTTILVYSDPDQSRSLAKFSYSIAQVCPYSTMSGGAVGHSMGAMATLDVLRYYWTCLDHVREDPANRNPDGSVKPIIHSINTPFLGTPYMKMLFIQVTQLLPSATTVKPYCTYNPDLTEAVASQWAASIQKHHAELLPLVEAHMAIPFNTGGWWSQGYDYCNYALALITGFSNINDGTVPLNNAMIPGMVKSPKDYGCVGRPDCIQPNGNCHVDNSFFILPGAARDEARCTYISQRLP